MMEGLSVQTLIEKFKKTKAELEESEKTLKILTQHRVDNSSHITKWPRSKFDRFFRKYEPVEKFESKNHDESEKDLDDIEQNPGKCTLQSAVVSKINTTRNRKAAIQKQNVNAKVRSRNRRILGMVQCTLQKFQNEETKRKLQDMKRIEIEQKIETAQIKEKEGINQQIIELHTVTKQKLLQLDYLQKMMDLIEPYELWKENQTYMLNFMMTNAEPRICFLPASHTPRSKKLHKEFKLKMLETIAQNEAKIKKELWKYQESLLSAFEDNVKSLQDSSALKEDINSVSVIDKIISEDMTGISDSMTKDTLLQNRRKYSEFGSDFHVDEELNFE